MRKLVAAAVAGLAAFVLSVPGWTGQNPSLDTVTCGAAPAAVSTNLDC